MGEANKFCYNGVRKAMVENLATEGKNYPEIVVSNSSVTEAEIQPYIELAEQYGYTVVSLIVEKRHENICIHNVSEKTMRNMERKLKYSTKLR